MNIKNFSRHIPEIEGKIGYVFKDKSLLTQSFTRTSFCNEHKSNRGPSPQSNEVLEFIGDGVLSTSIITSLLSDLTERYEYGIKTELGEGDFSNIKSKLSDKRNLSISTAALGLERFLIMGEGDTKLGIAKEPSVMEDLFESIVGAIYIDSGLDMAKVMGAVGKMLDMSVYKSEGRATGSAKGELQEWCADKKRRLPPPEYKTLSESGPDHKKVYHRAVYIGGEKIAEGSGKNLKAADTECAKAALEILKKRECKPQEMSKNATRVAPTAKNTQHKAQAKKALNPLPDPTGSAKKLKDIALSAKAPLPRFRDLGEAEFKNGITEYRVECSYLGIKATGTAPDRKLARETSALLVIKELKAKSKKK